MVGWFLLAKQGEKVKEKLATVQLSRIRWTGDAMSALKWIVVKKKQKRRL